MAAAGNAAIVSHGQIASMLMRTAVRDRDPRNISELAVSGTLPASQFYAGGGQHAETMQDQQQLLQKRRIAVDVDSHRRSRIASRAHSRLSQPRAGSVTASEALDEADEDEEAV